MRTGEAEAKAETQGPVFFRFAFLDLTALVCRKLRSVSDHVGRGNIRGKGEREKPQCNKMGEGGNCAGILHPQTHVTTFFVSERLSGGIS